MHFERYIYQNLEAKPVYHKSLLNLYWHEGSIKIQFGFCVNLYPL
jgi:hypothetical protein